MVDKVAHIDPSFKKAMIDEFGNPNDKPMPGDEFRRLKMLYKKLLEKERRDTRRKNFIERQEEEKKILNTGYKLIYPLLTYEQEYFIEDNYEVEENSLK